MRFYVDAVPSLTGAKQCLSRTGSGGLCPRLSPWFPEVGWLVLVLGWLLGFGMPCSGQSTLSEHQVKALFLFNFAKYVEWPAEAFPGQNTPLTIGIVGHSPCTEPLQKTVKGKRVCGHPMAVREVEKVEDMARCHILFLNDLDKKRSASILGQLRNRPVLTVGEADQFDEQGGVIGFLKKEGKVRLEINLKAAHQAQLEVSSKLLSVADHIIGK